MIAFITRIPALCAVFVILWSSGFVVAKYSLGHSGAFTVLFWRYLLVVIVLALLVTLSRQWQQIPPRHLTRHMAVGVLAHAVWLAAVLYAIDLGLSTGLAAFITALQPIMTGALSARMTGERVTAREWAGLALGLMAIAIVIGDGIAFGGSLLAYALAFVAVIAITLASLVDRGATVEDKQLPSVGEHQRGNADPLLLITFWHCTASLLILAPLAISIENLDADWNGSFIFSVAWLALVVSLGAYGLMFLLLRRLPAARVASLTYLSPPVTIFMAWLVLGETLTLTGFIGLVVAAFAVGLTLTARRPTVVH